MPCVYLLVFHIAREDDGTDSFPPRKTETFIFVTTSTGTTPTN
jgi:hypothetical protein